MGFEILPFKKGNQDRYEIHQITSETPWKPQYFCDDSCEDSDPEDAFFDHLFSNYAMEQITQLYLHHNPDEIPSDLEPQYSSQTVHAFGAHMERCDLRIPPSPHGVGKPQYY